MVSRIKHEKERSIAVQQASAAVTEATHPKKATLPADSIAHPAAAQRVLQMQTRHGNHHTVRALRQKAAGGSVQRFESAEHRQIGDTTKGAQAGRMKLANWDRDFPDNRKPVAQWPKEWQDYYKTLNADQQKVLAEGLSYGEIVALSGDFYRTFEELSNAPLKEMVKLSAFTHRDDASSTEQEIATGGRYLDLASHNETHFSRSDAGKNNMDVWRSMHTSAIMAAMQNKAEQAFAMNAAADHYLTDAFASGHMIMPRSQMMDTKFKNAKSKTLHDYDNTHGITVNNKRGDGPWVAYGDEMMNDPRNAMNKTLVTEAVVLSKQDIADALAAGQKYKIPKNFSVEPLIPIPTTKPEEMDRSNLGVAGSFLTDTLPAEAKTAFGVIFSTDEQTQAYMADNDDVAIRRQPHDQKIRMIEALFRGVTSDKDVIALKRLIPLADLTSAEKLHYIHEFLNGYVSDGDMQLVQAVINTTSSAEMQTINKEIGPRAIELGFRQRTELRVMLLKQ